MCMTDHHVLHSDVVNVKIIPENNFTNKRSISSVTKKYTWNLSQNTMKYETKL